MIIYFRRKLLRLYSIKTIFRLRGDTKIKSEKYLTFKQKEHKNDRKLKRKNVLNFLLQILVFIEK